jgi:polyhydroxyalkanoate synthesis regulator phasin
MSDLPSQTAPLLDAVERIRELERQIAELKKSWPAHSVPASLLLRLEALEEELDELQNAARQSGTPG